jgi:hypothetical protein
VRPPGAGRLAAVAGHVDLLSTFRVPAARFSSEPAGKAAGMSEPQVVAMHMPHRRARG